MMDTSDNRFLYMVKGIACIMVILIHVKFPGNFGAISETLSRFAVPMFFAVSGRFLLHEHESVEKDSIRRSVHVRLIHTIWLTFVAWGVYTLYSLIYMLSCGVGFAGWIHEKYNLFEFSRLLLFNSGKFIYDYSYTFDHLWYLFALIYVYFLIWIFAGAVRKMSGPLIVIPGGLLMFGELLQKVYPVRLFGIGISTWYVMRNWLFIGIPFMMLGIRFHMFIQTEKGRKLVKQKVLWDIFLFCGIICCIFECFFAGQTEVYIGSWIIVISLLFLSESQREKGWNILVGIGKYLSEDVYIWHVLVLSLIGVVSVNSGWDQSLWWNWIKPLLVIAVTLLSSKILCTVKQRRNGTI